MSCLFIRNYKIYCINVSFIIVFRIVHASRVHKDANRAMMATVAR